MQAEERLQSAGHMEAEDATLSPGFAQSSFAGLVHTALHDVTVKASIHNQFAYT